jgi:hypothetical protein
MDRFHELQVFLGFASAANLPLKEGSAVNADPPEPDILCTIGGEQLYFELGEIMWEPPDSPGSTLAKGYHLSTERSQRKANLAAQGKHEDADKIQTRGQMRYPPLLSIKQALDKKCSRFYTTQGRSVSLLLYFERQSPYEPYHLLFECIPQLKEIIGRNQFDRIWIYHHSEAFTVTVGDGNYGRLMVGNLVKLSELARPESSRAVVGSLRLRSESLAMSFDARFGEMFDSALCALNAHGALPVSRHTNGSLRSDDHR